MPSLTVKMKALLILEEKSRKIEIKLFPLCAKVEVLLILEENS